MPTGTEQGSFHEMLGLWRRAIRTQCHESIHCARLACRNVSRRIAQDVETTQLDRLLQACETFAELFLHLVAGSPRLVEQRSRLHAPNAVFRNDQDWHNVEKQPDNVAMKDIGDIVAGGNPRLVGRGSVEMDHHVLDHSLLPRCPASGDALWADLRRLSVRAR